MIGGLFLKIREGVNKIGNTLIRGEHFGTTILTIKRRDEEEGDRVVYLFPKSTTTIVEGDVLIIFGLQEDLSRFPRD